MKDLLIFTGGTRIDTPYPFEFLSLLLFFPVNGIGSATPVTGTIMAGACADVADGAECILEIREVGNPCVPQDPKRGLHGIPADHAADDHLVRVLGEPDEFICDTDGI